mgnify:FL=1
MDNNKFNEESKEELEREIQELKRQKEIRELQRQKEELEKTMFDSVGGNKAAEKDENTKKKVEKGKQNENRSDEGTNFFSNKKKIIILFAAISLVTIAAGTGIFFLNSNNKKKKSSFKSDSVASVFQGQTMASVTTPKVQTDQMSGKEAAEAIFKEAIGIFQRGEYASQITDKDALEATNAFSEAYKKITYTINNVTENGDKVILNVTLKSPDLSEIRTLLNQKAEKEAQQMKGKSVTEEEMNHKIFEWMKELIDQKVKDPNLKYMEETFDVPYTKINGEWTAPDKMDSKFNKLMTFNLDM